MKYTITHRTLYRYSSGVALCHNEARLLPRETPWQFCRPSRIEIRPRPALSIERWDFFGNRALYFAIQDIHQRLVVTVATEVEVLKTRPFNASSPSPPWEQAIRLLRDDLNPDTLEARHFVLDSPFIAAQAKFRQYAQPSFTPGRPLLEAVADLNRRINREFTYDPHFTTVATPLNKVLSERRGVCQDFAHLMIACLRALGLSARYVSGYLLTRPPPGKPRLIGADASHAWVSVFCPDARGGFWVDFDPTNNLLPDIGHITLAWGRDFGDVSPLRGVILGGDTHMPDVAVTVLPCEEETPVLTTAT